MKGRPSRKTNVQKKTKESLSAMSASLYGACVGLIVCIALAVLCAVVCVFSPDPDKLSTPLSMISLVCVFFTSGLLASKRSSAALPTGLMTGAILTLFLWLSSLFFSDAYSQGLPLAVELLIRTSFIVVSLVGSLVGVNAKIGKRRRRR